MDEYIRRGDAIELIERYGGGIAVREIKRLPAEDVKPERHGEWFGTVCSACGTDVSFYYDCNYCPICGALMDGEDGDNNDD